jgi:hypothetical protein
MDIRDSGSVVVNPNNNIGRGGEERRRRKRICDGKDDDDGDDGARLRRKRLFIPITTIVEAIHPPSLDEKYWKAKEDTVSMEQHVLRMIQFDATVCHPHRCVLVVMETLGFGKGRRKGKRNVRTTSGVVAVGGGGGDDDDDRNWLLHPDTSERVILGAFRILNDASLDGTGDALRYPVIVMSCAAISLAAAASVGGGSDGDGGSVDVAADDDVRSGELKNYNDDWNATAAVTLPDYWWRALDVSTEHITSAKVAMRRECTLGRSN